MHVCCSMSRLAPIGCYTNCLYVFQQMRTLFAALSLVLSLLRDWVT